MLLLYIKIYLLKNDLSFGSIYLLFFLILQLDFPFEQLQLFFTLIYPVLLPQPIFEQFEHLLVLVVCVCCPATRDITVPDPKQTGQIS